MLKTMREHLARQLEEIRGAGLFKGERLIASPQGAHIVLQDGRRVLNLCANNYLGLSGHPELIAAAQAALTRWGYGLSSVRFICGTQTLHKELERRVAEFLGAEDAILYSSCFDANGGLFEALLTEEDAVISDELNHASIIDGIRLCKARRLRYKNSDMADLEARLREAADARFRLVATDGVFSMDGTVADLTGICDLALRHGALVMVDDSHAVGVLGANGRGTHEHRDVMGRVDILTGTFGKALGGASGGYAAGRKEIVDTLRQRSRPYLFSNTLAPVVAAASLKALELVASRPDLRARLARHTRRFREGMAREGFRVPPGEHPIVPVMLGDAHLAARMAERLLAEGVYVVGFSYPVVPKDAARVRVQISAALEDADIDLALEKFARMGRELGVI
ncbi:MAG TPA: glycine C-acetyltransferase [Candidatus Methylomirabilis sp.]|nr:glycine C-acetyltransferase [Candidatus Methylomirabilis sp.]